MRYLVLEKNKNKNHKSQVFYIIKKSLYQVKNSKLLNLWNKILILRKKPLDDPEALRKVSAILSEIGILKPKIRNHAMKKDYKFQI